MLYHIKNFFMSLFESKKVECLICFSYIEDGEKTSTIKYTHAGGQDVGYVCQSCSEYIEDHSMDTFDL